MIVEDLTQMEASEIGCFPNLDALWSTFPRSVRMHMENVGKYADDMYRYMAKKDIEGVNEVLGENFASVSRQIFMLHDVGRYYIPFALLNKVGKLLDEEQQIIRDHTVNARRAIRSIYEPPFTDDVMGIWEEISVYHHEWYDGTGYPEGLKGKEIPLGARICAIADTYEGITSWKPYKKKQTTRQEAVEIMRAEAGKQFQPEFVDIFIKCVAQF